MTRQLSYPSKITLLLLAGIIAFPIQPTALAEPAPVEKKGLFKRIFSRTDKVDRRSDTISRVIQPKEDTAQVDARENDAVKRYPALSGYKTLEDADQQDIDDLIDAIYASYEARIGRMDPPDLKEKVLANLRSISPLLSTVGAFEKMSPSDRH